MKIRSTAIPGCYELVPIIQKDERGCFVKTFNSDFFSENGMETHFTEEYYTVSNQGVLRGLHFQIPPKQHAKLVYSVLGEVLDAVVDLRRGSPAYGKYECFTLNPEEGTMVYTPPGLAHGFYVLSQKATLVYNVTSNYSPEHDSGILWNSVNIPWPDRNPKISKRDQGFLPFSEFQSPFIYRDNEQS